MIGEDEKSGLRGEPNNRSEEPSIFDLKSWLTHSRRRALLFQFLLITAVLSLGYELYGNMVVNLESRKIASGFDFLETTAGFSIIQTLIPYSEASTYGRAFWVGLLNTLLVAILGIILATFLGLMIAIARLSRNWLISKIAMAYIEVVRNVPLLLHLFVWYFAVLRVMPHPRQSHAFFDSFFLNNRGLYLPKPLFHEGFGLLLMACALGLLGGFFYRKWERERALEQGRYASPIWLSLLPAFLLPLIASLLVGFPLSFELPYFKGFNFVGGIKIIPELMALLLALTIYTAAYIAEIIRAGILSVSRGQWEAARSLGMEPFTILRRIILPQALRVIIPPLTNQYLNLTKNSSLAVAIAYPDLVSVFSGIVLNQTGQAVEVLLITMGVYLTLSLLISLLMNWINAQAGLVER